jgi:hypothetical protein
LEAPPAGSFESQRLSFDSALLAAPKGAPELIAQSGEVDELAMRVAPDGRLEMAYVQDRVVRGSTTFELMHVRRTAADPPGAPERIAALRSGSTLVILPGDRGGRTVIIHADAAHSRLFTPRTTGGAGRR